jgi:hypothetical protein
MRVNRSGGSRRKAVHIDAALSMCPALATIILTVALVGLTAEALVPDLAYDDLACLASSDPDNPTTNDCDDSSKPVSQSNPTRLVSHFAKALLATVDLALPRSLMPVHVLAGIDLVNQPLLPDYFLPNGVHGPTVRVGRGADAESRRDLLFLPLPGTASRAVTSSPPAVFRFCRYRPPPPAITFLTPIQMEADGLFRHGRIDSRAAPSRAPSVASRSDG